MTVRLGLAALALAILAAGCGGVSSAAGTAAATPTSRGAPGEQVTLRLGYFPTITHAPALVGLQNGLFEKALGDAVALETVTFNAGPAAVEALFTGALDATYIGPSPAINAYAQSNGEAVRIIAGTTSGGAFLVVRDGISGADGLRGARIATPQLGNTQDVALRAWLLGQGLSADTEGGGDVAILPQDNAQTLETFQSGDIDGAWVPEPWATRLRQEGGAAVLVDERDLWEGGRFVTAHLVVRTAYLEEHPEVVARLLQGHLAALEAVNGNRAAAQQATNSAIEALTGKPLAPEVIAAAWESLEFTPDPIASSLVEAAEDARSVGLLDEVDLSGIYQLGPLNEALEAAGQEPVEGIG